MNKSEKEIFVPKDMRKPIAVRCTSFTIRTDGTDSTLVGMAPMIAILRNLMLFSKKVIAQTGDKPWLKGNSWLDKASISELTFGVTQVYYRDMYTRELLNAGITDISFKVTKV